MNRLSPPFPRPVSVPGDGHDPEEARRLEPVQDYPDSTRPIVQAPSRGNIGQLADVPAAPAAARSEPGRTDVATQHKGECHASLG